MTADSTTQSFPSTASTASPGGMLSGLMEMGMMSMAQNATMTTLLMSQLMPALGQNQAGGLFGRPSHWSTTTAPPLHMSPPTQQHSSPPAAQIANPMSLDDFIIENSFQGIREKIEAIGWEPGQAVFDLDDKPWARPMIFGAEGAGFKLMEWIRFAKAAEVARKRMQG